MKKFLSLSLAAAMIVSLAACQSCGNTEGETQAAGNGVENVTVEGAETYKIGVIGPLTGDSASYGISVQNGAEIAAMEINKAGGIKAGDKTYQVEIIAADDEAKPDKAITAYNTLMDAGTGGSYHLGRMYCRDRSCQGRWNFDGDSQRFCREMYSV